MKKTLRRIYLLTSIALFAACSGQDQEELTRVDVQILETEGNNSDISRIIDQDAIKALDETIKQIQWEVDREVDLGRKPDVKATFFYTVDENMPERLVDYNIWFNEETNTSKFITEDNGEHYGTLDQEDTNTLKNLFGISHPNIGLILEGIDVPDPVLTAAKEKVQKEFEGASEQYPDYTYRNWRITSLEFAYTYEDIEGMELVIYRLNYEFFSASAEHIQLAGGMYRTEDDWVMPTYANSTYLIFQQEDPTLSYLNSVMVNDSNPGDPLFTADLQRVLKQSKAKSTSHD